ncbi:MAG: hypothetical protein NXI07_03665 [bacterium]|nr:hypothetical protein [bacterium]
MEVALVDLWLPIIIATVSVFFASSIIWMLLPYHKKDIQFLPNEEELTAKVSEMNIKPGLYMFPNCQNAKDYKSEAYLAKWEAGPWGIITVQPGQPNFGMNLLKTFLAYLVITIFVAYITAASTRGGADYLAVFQVAGAAGVLGHCMGGLAGDFFLGKPTRFIITGFIDGVIFALITAGVIASMWPAATAALEGTLIVQ